MREGGQPDGKEHGSGLRQAGSALAPAISGRGALGRQGLRSCEAGDTASQEGH